MKLLRLFWDIGISILHYFVSTIFLTVHRNTTNTVRAYIKYIGTVLTVLMVFYTYGMTISTGITAELTKSGIKQIDITGKWTFQLDPDEVGDKEGWYKPEYLEKGWEKVPVPGYWEDFGFTDKFVQKYGDWEPYNGYAWYRYWIKVPVEWQGYPLRIFLGMIDDSDITYFNGTSVGTNDKVTAIRSYLIPVSAVKYGDKNLLSIKVLDTGGKGGICAGIKYIRPVLPGETGTKLTVDCESKDGTYIYNLGTEIKLKFTLTTELPDEFTGTGTLKITNFWGKQVLSDQFNLTVSSGSSKEITVNFSAAEPGHYDIHVQIDQAGFFVKETYGSFAVINKSVEVENSTGSPFGLNGGALFHLSKDDLVPLGNKRLAIDRRIGAVWGRNDFWWGVIEPEKGKLDWTRADTTMDMYYKHNINLLPILCYASAWSSPHGAAPVGKEEINHFCTYVSTMVARYKKYVKYWEVWNEPNIPEFWSPSPNVEHYTQLLKSAYTAAKKTDPECKIVGCVTAGTDLSFIDSVLKLGGGQYMDVVAVHPYQIETPELSSGGQVAAITQLLEILKKYAVNIPVWMTEVGWQTFNPGDEYLQAIKIARLYVHGLSIPQVERIFYFNIDDWGPRGTGDGGHFGLCYINLMPKPGLVAYYTTARMLSDAKFLTKLAVAENVYAYLYQKKETQVLVLWHTENSVRNVKLNYKSDKDIVLTNLMGVRSTISPQNSKVTVPISEVPVFLTGKFQ